VSSFKHVLNEKVVCADGFEMSVQANDGAYCSPRSKASGTRYTEVEIGYPNSPEELILSYAEDQDTPTMTVYPYVPSMLVGLVIAKHGGMVSGQVPNGVPPLWAVTEGDEQ